MQDIHLIESSGGGGRLFAGGDRRLRPHHQHQDLKCPRCGSLNTKFCYYNNYNLSQPRHFCKSCRRYWTKGGVLRNVPVGGCVRKTKRSKKPKSKTSIRSSDAAPQERKSSNSGNSSSDSSSLTANTTTAKTTPMTKTEVSGSNSTNSTPAMLLNFNESSTRFFNIPQSSTLITTFDPLTLNQSSAGNMPSDIGTFTSLMTSSTDQLPLGFNMAAGISSFPLHQHNTEHVVENHNHPNQLQWDVKMAEMGIESRRSNGGLAGTEDWQDSADEALYDLTGTVDQSYWSQSQWNDHGHHHHHLNYLP